METERRETLRWAARAAVAAALGALGVALGLRRGGARDEGYCDRAGRCGGCPVTDDCEIHRAIGGGS